MYDELTTRPSDDPASTPGTGSYIPGPGFSAGQAGANRPPAPPAAPFAGVPPGGLPTAPPLPEIPVPWLAALLGLIPGVGAMYNGQFAKGIAHLAIFAVLVSLADHVNGIFGVFVAGWIFYQAFEAFHTARARRDGLPLPNAFGLNEVGERLGFGRNWPGNVARPAAGNPPPAVPWSGSYPPGFVPPPSASAWPATPAGYPAPFPGSPASQAPGANWAGYVPPSAFGGPAQAPVPPEAVPLAAEPVPAGAASAWGSVPYGATYSGAVPPTNTGPGFPTAAGFAGAPARRFPVGAVLLIVLGGVFLLSNVAPAWHLHDRWLLPILLAAASVWSFIRRVRLASNGSFDLQPGRRASNLICALRLPALLMTLAVMFVFQASGWLTLGQTWPLLLVILGGLLLLERTLGRTAQVTSADSVAPPEAPGSPGDLAGRGNL